jgi:hypothetical protein
MIERRARRPGPPCAAAIATALLLTVPGAWIAGLPARNAGEGAAAPTRADLDLGRRRVALLQSERALAATRGPYVVLDLAARTLRYGLMGMDVREVSLASVEADGLRRASPGTAPDPRLFAGIVTLKEKERDPRLTPLTPAQIEAGAADENAADVLPPEAPASYDLLFRQPIVMHVTGSGEGTAGLLTSVAAWWQRLRGGWPRGRGDPGLRVFVRLEEDAAREVYRSLVPGQRLVVVPPPGFLLPDAEQESPGGIRPGRPAPPPKGPPATSPGVPFRIPPPVESAPAKAPEGAPSSPGEPVPEEPPLPEGDDWVPADDPQPQTPPD